MHSDSIAQWLASTARRLGYISSKAKNSKKQAKASKGQHTYTIAIKDWTVLAEHIAGQDDPPINVPRKLAALLDATIALRQSYSGVVSDAFEDTTARRDSDDRHAFFVSVLKKVREILAPRLPKESAVLPDKPKDIEEVINVFEHLELEEPSEEFEQAPDVQVPSAGAAARPIYKAERLDDSEESFFAFYLLLHDLNKLRTEVTRAWEGYKHGMHDIVAASITTNTAVDLARAMIDDYKEMFAKHGGAHRMLEMYYAGACFAEGTDPNFRARPDDEINYRMYDLAEAIFWTASSLLGAFCGVLKAYPTPEMKLGFYGVYDPSSDRQKKSDREKLKEDKILLLEILPEFFYFSGFNENPPAEDELTRLLSTMFQTKQVTLPLVFATTLFLDIHHILRDQVDLGFKKLADAADFARNNINMNLDFHKDIQMDTWPKRNDDALQQFVGFVQRWVQEDRQRKIAERAGRVNIPQPYHLFRKHPWSCGLWKYYIQMRHHEISITFANAWGGIMSCAHLYNAVQNENMLPEKWKDMDVATSLQGRNVVFIGEAPKDPDDCLKRFAIAMGASAVNMAKSKRKKKGLVLSKRGPQGLKELGAVLQMFKGRYCNMNGCRDLRAEDVEKIIEKSNWEYEMDENDGSTTMVKDIDATPASQQKSRKQLPVAKLLGLLRDLLHAEMVEISFDYLRHHRQCWRLLRVVKDHCRDQLIRIYGPGYIEKESQLPFIVGYVLMTASSTKQFGDLLKAKLPTAEVTSEVLLSAANALQTMVATGAGEMIVSKILPEGLGVQIEFESGK